MKTAIRLITTSLFGLALMAYGQNDNASIPKAQVAAPQANQSKESMPANATFDPWLGNVTSTYAYVGSSVFNQKVIDIFGFNFGTSSPAATSCQPRQSYPFQSTVYHDTFACQVVLTGNNYIRVRVQRLDAPFGWGQNLRLDFIVFSAINN
jgi:hypothetical protein